MSTGSSGLGGRAEENAEFTLVLEDPRGVNETDIDETGAGELIGQVVPVESVMSVEVLLARVEGTVRVLLEVRDSQPTALDQESRHGPQQRIQVIHVVQRHGAPHNVMNPVQPVMRQIDLDGAQPLSEPGRLDPLPGDPHHPGRRISHDDRANPVGEQDAQPTGAGADVDRTSLGAQLHGPDDGPGHRLLALLVAGVVIPGRCRIVESFAFMHVSDPRPGADDLGVHAAVVALRPRSLLLVLVSGGIPQGLAVPHVLVSGVVAQFPGALARHGDPGADRDPGSVLTHGVRRGSHGRINDLLGVLPCGDDDSARHHRTLGEPVVDVVHRHVRPLDTGGGRDELGHLLTPCVPLRDSLPEPRREQEDNRRVAAMIKPGIAVVFAVTMWAVARGLTGGLGALRPHHCVRAALPEPRTRNTPIAGQTVGRREEYLCRSVTRPPYGPVLYEARPTGEKVSKDWVLPLGLSVVAAPFILKWRDPDREIGVIMVAVAMMLVLVVLLIAHLWLRQRRAKVQVTPMHVVQTRLIRHDAAPRTELAEAVLAQKYAVPGVHSPILFLTDESTRTRLILGAPMWTEEELRTIGQTAQRLTVVPMLSAEEGRTRWPRMMPRSNRNPRLAMALGGLGMLVFMGGCSPPCWSRC